MPMSDEMKGKIALYCDIAKDGIIEGLDAQHVYHLPMTFEKQGFSSKVLKRLGLPDTAPDLTQWERISHAVMNPKRKITVAICGKYMEHARATRHLYFGRRSHRTRRAGMRGRSRNQVG